MPNLRNLPKSDDEFFEDAEKYINNPTQVEICSTHTKDGWMEHEGYEFSDGEIRCQRCPWGAKINTGRYRVLNGRVIELKALLS